MTYKDNLSSGDSNVPADATAMQAEAVVRAAIEWRNGLEDDPKLSREEWVLYDALTRYGSEFKGLRAQ